MKKMRLRLSDVPLIMIAIFTLNKFRLSTRCVRTACSQLLSDKSGTIGVMLV